MGNLFMASGNGNIEKENTKITFGNVKFIEATSFFATNPCIITTCFKAPSDAYGDFRINNNVIGYWQTNGGSGKTRVNASYLLNKGETFSITLASGSVEEWPITIRDIYIS